MVRVVKVPLAEDGLQVMFILSQPLHLQTQERESREYFPALNTSSSGQNTQCQHLSL
jgi:hypothetical protein